MICPNCQGNVAQVITEDNAQVFEYPDGSYLICLGCLTLGKVYKGSLLQVPEDEVLPHEVIATMRRLEASILQLRHFNN